MGAAASSKWHGNAKLQLLVVHMEGHRETGHRDGEEEMGQKEKTLVPEAGVVVRQGLSLLGSPGT